MASSVHNVAKCSVNQRLGQTQRFTHHHRRRVATLGDRERRLLQLAAEGKRNREIAGEMTLAVKSVETYRSRLMKKLGCASAAELVRHAIREGIVQAGGGKIKTVKRLLNNAKNAAQRDRHLAGQRSAPSNPRLLPDNPPGLGDRPTWRVARK